jgi:hypothetical protein
MRQTIFQDGNEVKRRRVAAMLCSRYLTEDLMIKKARETDSTNFGLARLGQ